MQMLHIYIDPRFGDLSGSVYSTIEQLLEMAGWKSIRVHERDPADLVYAEGESSAKALPCAGPSAWKAVGTHLVGTGAGFPVPAAAILDQGTPPAFDPVLAAHAVLCGWPERDDEVLEKKGIPGAGLKKWGLLETPVFTRISDILQALVRERFPDLPPRPKWPAGKAWAVCLTHDCDNPIRYRPLGYLRDARMCMQKNDLAASAACLAKAVVSAAKRLPPDPHLQSWRGWVEFERRLGVRSSYYIGVWNRYQPQSSWFDLGYSAEDPRIRAVVSNLLEGGWEIGLHSSIRAWEFEGRFGQEADQFEKIYGVRPDGFRGHYWSLDPEAPERTLVAARKSGGFQYDSSFGMNVAYGYRRGSAYPYRPFSPQTGEYVGLMEIAPVLMDHALWMSAPAPAGRVDNFRACAGTVKTMGGLLVLDWHDYTLTRGVMGNLARSLFDELTEMAQDRTCWFATPRQVAAWCARERWAE